MDDVHFFSQDEILAFVAEAESSGRDVYKPLIGRFATSNEIFSVVNNVPGFGDKTNATMLNSIKRHLKPENRNDSWPEKLAVAEIPANHPILVKAGVGNGSDTKVVVLVNPDAAPVVAENDENDENEV